jgi:hypothetical protein
VSGGEDQILAGANLVVLVEGEPHVLGETFAALTVEGGRGEPACRRRPREPVVDLHERVGHLDRVHVRLVPAGGLRVPRAA